MRGSHQNSHVDRVSGLSHLPIHLPGLRYSLEEGQREVALTKREVIFIAVQSKNSLPFPGQQLLLHIGRRVYEYKAKLPVNFLIAVSRGTVVNMLPCCIGLHYRSGRHDREYSFH